jgi:hypothetical protein
VLVPADYASPEQLEQVQEAALHIRDKDGWFPSRAMIDKSAAERNALRMGMSHLNNPACTRSNWSAISVCSLAPDHSTPVPVPYHPGNSTLGEGPV